MNPTETINLTDTKQLKLQELEIGLYHKFRILSSIAKDLAYIRDHHLYPAHLTFDQYAKSKWGFDEENVDRMCIAVDVVADVEASSLGKHLSPLNQGVIQEFLDLSRPERLELAKRIDQELCVRELSVELIKECKLALFPCKVNCE